MPLSLITHHSHSLMAWLGSLQRFSAYRNAASKASLVNTTLIGSGTDNSL
ncbi:hypothetical protein KPSA3_03487 [Pseudomonas syringae pv. actinidiae]|uniref:Uncharacterized protein n=1 Tax=Pseudomonas syringae pv. actinidiae TaxID=103796 RepID=A0AAN4Q518_PSESF|nr:hypothetical protein KPSA3_03487 [Pseudomonas syringae pv. actinidiae]